MDTLSVTPRTVYDKKYMSRILDLFFATLLATCLFYATPGLAQDKTGPSADPPVVSTSEQAALLARINKALNQPGENLDPVQIRDLLDRLIVDATQLANVSEPGPLQLQALSLQMQATYQRIVRFPKDVEVDRRLSRMRAAARRAKAIDEATAGAVGDFWLMTADLFDINRSALDATARRQQTRQLLEGHLEKHASGPTAKAAQAALDRLVAEEKSIGEGGAANRAVDLDPKPPVNPTDPTTPEPVDPAERVREALAQLNAPAYLIGQQVRDETTKIAKVTISSRYQAKPNVLRVLRPDGVEEDASLDVLFVLPVEPGEGTKWGDGLEAIRAMDLHNKLGLLVVMPTFNNVPWYADHPTQPQMWQESYMVKAVVPAVDHLYPAKDRKRLLLGFSKSGWGAVSLLARYPQTFDAAAAWDAPLMVDNIERFEMGKVFATQKTFERYELSRSLRSNARILRKKTRIAIMGYDAFADHTQRAHGLLDQLRIPHHYADGPKRRHHWESGWVGEAATQLMKMTGASDNAPAAPPLPPAP